MKLLLDTHFLIWLSVADHKITSVERTILGDPTNELLISALSIWEIRIKWNTLDREGRRKGALSPDEALRFARENHLRLVALHADDFAIPIDPPLAHRDPFDEMLLVHAGQLGARFFTRDKLLSGHPIAYHP